MEYSYMIMSILFPFMAAAFLWMIKGKNRSNDRIIFYATIVCVLELVFAMVIDFNISQSSLLYVHHIAGLGIQFVYSEFRGLYATITSFAWVITFLFSMEYLKEEQKILRYTCFNLMTLGATLGIFYAADFFTVFVFFEIMSLTSFVWILQRETKEAKYAAGTYLGIAIAGGMSILMGLFFLWNCAGTLNFDELSNLVCNVENKTQLYLAAGCMAAGFGAKASAFPVHVWLPQSYTQAPAPETALLSAILSKTGIFGLLCVSCSIMQYDENWGQFMVIIGILTMVLGGIAALCNQNLKTTLAYSSMSQIGFILVGIGMQALLEEENVLAVRGTVLHMVNHSFVKLLLFLTAAVVYSRVGSYDLNVIRGYGKKKKFLQISFLIGALGVGGIPLFNGYISKTLLHESIIEYKLIAENVKLASLIEMLFLFSGGLTLAYMAKLYIALFLQNNREQEIQKKYEAQKMYMSISSKVAFICCMIPIVGIGLLPDLIGKSIMDKGMELMHITAFFKKISYFSLENLSGAMISMGVGIILYLLVVSGMMLHGKEKIYRNLVPTWINMEKYIYRDVFYRFVPLVLCIISRLLDSLLDWIVVLLRKTVYADRALPYELPEGNIVTHQIARFHIACNTLYHRIKNDKPIKGNVEHKLALKQAEIFENARIIERSLSFGLYMFCLGLALTLIYLLIVNS